MGRYMYIYVTLLQTFIMGQEKFKEKLQQFDRKTERKQ